MKKITTLLLALILLVSLPQVAQAQGWTKTFDKQSTTDAALRVAKTSNGGGLFAGYLSYLIGGGYYIMEVDSLGNELWYQTFTSPQPVTIRSLKTLSTGEIVVMGVMSGVSPAPGSTYIAKHDASGARQWFKTYYSSISGSSGGDLLVLPGDTLILGGHVLNPDIVPNEVEVALYKLDANGDSVKYVQYADLDTLPGNLLYLTRGQNGEIVGVGRSTIEASDHTLYGFDSDLNQLWVENTLLGASNDIFIPNDVIATSDGGYLTTGLELNTGQPNGLTGYAYFVKNAADGTFQWVKHFHLVGDVSHGNAIAEPVPGKYVLLATGLLETAPSTYYSGKPYLIFTDTNGDLVSHKVYPGPTFISVMHMNDMAVMDDKGFLMCGSIGQGVADQDIHLIRTDSLGNIYKAVVAGNVFGDNNENCQPDVGEPALKNWIVTATSAVDSFYGVTDALGNYAMTCDTGTYTLKVLAPSPYWTDTLCSDSLTATVLPTTDTLAKNIAVGKTLDCPALHVSVDAVFLRRCLPGPPYTVSYCNNGTQAASNVYVEITLDTELILDSASTTFTSLGGNSYRFDVGTLDITDCGSFLMYVRASCNLQVFGQTHCVDANIFPNASCLPPNPLWDGARLELTSDCQPDSLAFMLVNTGSNMSIQKSFTIIQDDVMYASGSFQLLNGESFVRKVPANGATWTFVTEQTPFFPGNQRLVRSVESCGLNGSGNFSLGFVTQFPQIGPDPSAAQLCLIDRGAYDPNDKTPQPKGIGMEGAIDKEQQMNYRIRFQNTGTDTAFLVVIMDTLSDNLDLLSIRNVRTSHNMEMSILPGRILQFAYPNILLPDSNVNEPMSHGFVSFDIDLVADLPVGTEITNRAFIFFDQNPAIITNTTLNTIGELFKTWLSVAELSSAHNRLKLYPNPTQGLLNLEIEGEVSSPVTFRTFDISGKLIMEVPLPAGSKHQLQLDLAPGMYLFDLYSGAERLGNGKLIAY